MDIELLKEIIKELAEFNCENCNQSSSDMDFSPCRYCKISKVKDKLLELELEEE